MKKLLIAFAGFAFLFPSCKDEAPDPTLVSEVSLTSKFTGGVYNLKISRPADYSTSSRKYATIYVLDGEENFDFVACQASKLSRCYGVSDVLVVSIGYGNDRNLDYTPTKTSGMTGGAPQFLDFFKEELVPMMERDFRADTVRSSRIILGHSYGGLFGAYAFATQNNFFGNYIILSPSLWYDNEITLKMEFIGRSSNGSKPQVVFIGGGQLENSGRMQAPVDGFYLALKANYPYAAIVRNLETDLDHVGSRNPNIEKGLDFYFKNR